MAATWLAFRPSTGNVSPGFRRVPVRSLFRSVVLNVPRADHQLPLLGQGRTQRYRGSRLFCSREARGDDGRSLVATEEERDEKHGHANDKASNSNVHGHENDSGDDFVTRLDEKTVLGRVTEVVVETVEVVAQTTADVAEVVAEKVEVAAHTMAFVGELSEPVPIEQSSVDTSSALKTVALWVSSAVAFGAVIGLTQGSTKASEFFAGYILEQSLSVDNLFVFVLIFNYFQVPLEYQGRVLTYGLAGAVVFRATMITAGVATIQIFSGVNLVFAGILLFTAYKILTGSQAEEEGSDLSQNFIVKTCQNLIPVTPAYDGHKFFTVVDGVQRATPLFLTVAILELSDVAFAVDSIPAVFGVTRDPFIIFSSNIFAILGLRSLYTVISATMAELDYLQPAVGTVLGFIGSKMVAEYFGFHVPTEVSLGVVAGVLSTGVVFSLISRSSSKQQDSDD